MFHRHKTSICTCPEVREQNSFCWMTMLTMDLVFFISGRYGGEEDSKSSPDPFPNRLRGEIWETLSGSIFLRFANLAFTTGYWKNIRARQAQVRKISAQKSTRDCMPDISQTRILRRWEECFKCIPLRMRNWGTVKRGAHCFLDYELSRVDELWIFSLPQFWDKLAPGLGSVLPLTNIIDITQKSRHSGFLKCCVTGCHQDITCMFIGLYQRWC
jgi:hypothetical protein